MIRCWMVGSMVVGAGLLLACSGGSSTGDGTGGTFGAGGALGGGGAGGSGACLPSKTLEVTASGSTAYVIDGASNPDLTLCRGNSYTFAVNTPGHPFFINLVQGTGSSHAYSSGVTGNGTDNGTVAFTVPSDAPATLFYNCAIHAAMTGTIHVVD